MNLPLASFCVWTLEARRCARGTIVKAKGDNEEKTADDSDDDGRLAVVWGLMSRRG